jgi:hypothetical protein
MALEPGLREQESKGRTSDVTPRRVAPIRVGRSAAITYNGRVLRHAWAVWIATGLYCFWGILLIAQKPGLQYDEAMLIAGAVHVQHSPELFELERTPNAWVCPFGRCIPLMSAYYVGAVKECAVLPFFALFGPRTPFVRLASLLLSALGIWGIYVLVAERFDRSAAAMAAFLIAMNPAFAGMTVFDNGAFGAMMAALGLTCACVALYDTRRTFWTALALGFSMGFGVWARANYLWILIAGAVATLLVFRRQVFIPARHWLAILLGGLIGGAPFLVFQIASKGATWTIQEAFVVPTSLATLLRERAFFFADMLLSDGEHRLMWAGPPLPLWQLWLFPALALAACFICLFGGRGAQPRQRSFARALALTFLITAALLFLSRLPVAEHHLIVLLPFAAVMAVVACTILQAKHKWILAVSSALLLIYLSSALYWQVAAIRGLRNSGGVDVWSDAGLQLARYLDQNFRDREVKFLDWGLQYNMYVLTDARVKSREIYSPASEDLSFEGKPWIDEIREGGVFVMNGPENRQYAKPSAGFLHALAVTRPVLRTYSVAQRGGQPYAEVIEIQPNSIRGPAQPGELPDERLSMQDLRSDDRLTGFYPPEEGGFRWTKREFSARLGFSLPDASGARLVLRLYIPDNAIQTLGPMTLSARIGTHALVHQTWSQAGSHIYRRDLDPALVAADPIRVDFALDKSLPPRGSDARELGIIVREISLEPR